MSISSRIAAGLLSCTLGVGLPAAHVNAGAVTAIANLSVETGDHPYAAAIFDNVVGRQGALYTTTTGGAGTCYESYGCGTVVKLTPPTTGGGAWTLQTLHAFNGADGDVPFAGLIFDTAGALYGTTKNGGALDLGTVFKLTPPSTAGGTWTETVLHTFTGGVDGFMPFSALLFDSVGALYGTTWKGGSKGAGIAFKLIAPNVAGGAWLESIYEFDGITGSRLQGGLTRDTFGVLYGVTNRGGIGNCVATNCGTVFALTAPVTTGGTWTHTVLANFTGPNGGDPESTPAFHLGSLYGTGDYGGANDVGVVFQYAP